MDIFNSYFTIIGVVAFCAGIYMLFTKKLLWRNTGSASRETILKFLPIDAATYIIEGILMVIMGLPKYFPFVEKTAVIYSMIGLSLAILVANVVLSRKFFPDAKPPEPKGMDPRLK